MSVNQAISRRKLGLPGRIQIDFLIDRIRLKEATRLSSPALPDADDLKTYGPLASAKLRNNIIAVANEHGYVNLLQTERELKDIAQWVGHDNAIFDMKATPDQEKLITASGDATIKLWDVESKNEITSLHSHHSSVKSISIYDSNIIASGSRDGSIKVHDLRLKLPTVIVIRDAHRNRTIAKPRRISTKTDPISCVTNVVFDEHFPRIYSTGANDATIKLWDLRKFAPTNKPRRTLDGQLLINQPNIEVHHPSKGVHCGYSHLLLSSYKVYAACSDNKIYCYDNFGSNEEPIKLIGNQYDTYLRLAVMDDRYLLSGTKGGGAMIWTLGNKCSSMYYPETTKQPIGQLKPDNSDNFDTTLIETDWESLSIFTFRDDRLVCKWTMQHVLESERKKLACDVALPSSEQDVTIEMADIIDVNVLRPNHRVSNVQNNGTL